MGDHIGIAVATKARLAIKADASQNQRLGRAAGVWVHVEPLADANRRYGRSRRLRYQIGHLDLDHLDSDFPWMDDRSYRRRTRRPRCYLDGRRTQNL